MNLGRGVCATHRQRSATVLLAWGTGTLHWDAVPFDAGVVRLLCADPRPINAPRFGLVTKSEVDGFFREYVFGFMAGDVRREIEGARRDEPAGNFLCALALLCYTEVLGGIRRGTLASGNGRTNFECFFRELGPPYAQLLDNGVDAYKLFRCEMAHEYLIKGSATVSMLKGVEPAGIALGPDGRRYFCVERYSKRSKPPLNAYTATS